MATSYKILGQSAPADTNNANLYTVPAATSVVASTIHVTNTTNTAATCRIFARKAGAAASAANALAYDTVVPANGVYGFTEGFTFAATDVITVQTGTANALTFHIFGSEIA